MHTSCRCFTLAGYFRKHYYIQVPVHTTAAGPSAVVWALRISEHELMHVHGRYSPAWPFQRRNRGQGPQLGIRSAALSRLNGHLLAVTARALPSTVQLFNRYSVR